MTQYVSEPLETDPDAIAQEAFDYIEARFPNWVPADGNLDTILIEAWAQAVAELRELETDVRDQIFRYFGATLHAILPIEATNATVNSTWTMADNAGHTVPAETQVAIPSGDDFIAFEVAEDVTVPAGSTVTAAGAVLLTAVEAGEEGSGLSGTPVLIDQLDYVASIALVGTTTGGVDAEPDEDYLNRLTAELQLLAPRPIVPSDFAVLARRVAGVERAVAIDLYNPLHNLLSVNQASLETDTTGWAADLNCSIIRSTAQAADGSASLRLSSTASGDMKATTPTGASGIAVTPNDEYTALASFRADASVRSVRLDIRWFTSGGATVSTSQGTAVADTTTGFTQASVTARAPETAAFAAVMPVVLATGGAAELHYVDKFTLRRGTSTVWAAGGSPATGNERMVTVVVAADNGLAVSSAVKTAVDVLLQAYREVNFVVHVADPSYSTIDVTFSAVAHSGWELADVETRAEAAVTAYLDPATWGDPEDDDTGEWINQTTVRYGELYAVLNAVEGLNYVTALTLGVQGGTMAEQNVVLAGVVPLPLAGTVTGTIVAP